MYLGQGMYYARFSSVPLAKCRPLLFPDALQLIIRRYVVQHRKTGGKKEAKNVLAGLKRRDRWGRGGPLAR
jgi:hypothetical protein